jgi:hypothetical protein
MAVETDSHGRLYLSSELRKKYGERFHIVEYQDRLELIPIDEDPLEAVREEVGDSLEEKSVAELREDALQNAKREAKADLGTESQDSEDAAE